jgi:hypothetical protein
MENLVRGVFSILHLSDVRACSALAVCVSTGCLLACSAPAAGAAPPVIGEESVADIGSSSATLLAQVNPEGTETTYRFEYGTSAVYGARIPVPGGDAGAGTSVIEVQAHPQHLLAGKVYHFRMVVEYGDGEVHEGPDQTFTTQALPGGLVLPDGRAWELVSPAEKYGTQVAMFQPALTQASEDGSAISYDLAAPFVPNPAGNAAVTQAISRRGPGGWGSAEGGVAEDLATPHDGPALSGNERYGEYEFFSPDLTYGLVTPFGETPLSPEVTEPTSYIRDNNTGVYTPLLTAANVAPGVKFGNVVSNEGQEGFLTASPNLGHIVLRSNDALTTGAQETGQSLYYDWTAGKLELIVPPETAAEIPEGRAVIGSSNEAGGNNMRGAVPNNGLRVFWSSASSEENVYMTDMADDKATRLDAAQGVAEPSVNRSRFEIANSEGSLVFFTDESQLTTSAGGGLYVYNVETGKLTLVTVAAHGGEEPRVEGLVLGAAEDGSDVYLVAKGVLSEAPNARQEKAVAGADNLYVMHREVNGSAEAWTASFIAKLSSGDETEWTFGEMAKQTVEVSNNGRYLAFMSENSLAGYDNRDANSGNRDEEVYLYDADSARLVCASCDPTGARPVGWLEPFGGGETPRSDLSGAWRGRWVAATIPGRTEFWSGFMDDAVREPTYVMDGGRLFFDSHDALVPQDINGVGDVYEYEPGGVGSCAPGGSCIGLISGGVGSQESAFADASASGDDVFFLTADPLVSQDTGTESDMYDAHVCSTQSPCPSSVVTPPECTTADSCRAAPAPQPGAFGAPPSATFSGQGNITPILAPSVSKKTTKKAIKCAKGKKLSHGRCVKKKSKKKKTKRTSQGG